MRRILPMIKMQSKLAVLLFVLLKVACKQQNSNEPKQTKEFVTEDSIMDDDSQKLQMTIYEDRNHCIYLEKVNGDVYCYVDSQKVVFNDDLLDDGAIGIYYHRPANSEYIYIIGATSFDCKGGWETGLHLYRMNIRTLTLKHIGNYAGIRFEDNGFKAATARLLNPDAECRADYRYAIRNYFFDNSGRLIRKGRESEDEKFYEIYGDGLIDPVGLGFWD